MKDKNLQPFFTKNNIPIVFAIDSNFVVYLGVTLESIIKNSSNNNNYDIIVLSNGLSIYEENIILNIIKDMNNFNVRFVNVSEYFEGLSLSLNLTHITQAAYYRFCIPEICKNYNKVVYLDCDIIVLVDIADFFNIDIGDNFVLGSPEFGTIINMNKDEKCFEYHKNVVKLADPVNNYLQAGVLLFNTKQMIIEDIQSKLFDSALSNNFNCQTQDPISQVCQGRIKFVDYGWNVLNYLNYRSAETIKKFLPEKYYKEYLQYQFNPRILHFASKFKPWYDPTIISADLFWKYARMLPFYETIIFKMIENKCSGGNKNI